MNGYRPATREPQPRKTPNRQDAWTALAQLPRVGIESFTRPADTLRVLVEKQDIATGLMVAVLSLLLSYLAGAVLADDLVRVLFSALTKATGVRMASGDASLAQGIRYVAGRITVQMGLMLVLCQLVAMVVFTASYMMYICASCRVEFSWELALGFLGVTSMCAVPSAVLAMALSLITPALALVPCCCAALYSYLQAGDMLGLITARSEEMIRRGRVITSLVSAAITLLLMLLISALFMNGITTRVLSLLSAVGTML